MDSKATQLRTVGTSEACRLAGIPRRSFNQAIFTGNYSIAPPTSRGAERQFALNDVVAIAVFSDAVRNGLSQAAANNCAMAALESLKADPRVDAVAIGELASDDAAAAPETVYAAPNAFDMIAMTYRGRPIVAVRTIPIGLMRKRLAAAISACPAPAIVRRPKRPGPTLARAL